jgi:hypothetical protein
LLLIATVLSLGQKKLGYRFGLHAGR